MSLQCAFCQQDIEEDSSFCDQCGKQLMMCPSGNHLCSTNFCAKHGQKAVPYVQSAMSATQAVTPAASASIVPNGPNAVAAQSPAAAPAKPAVTIVAPSGPKTQGRLCLLSAAERLNVTPASGDVIGRRAGQHVQAFARFGQISGSHIGLRQDDQKQWWVKDLNSSNGTFLNKSRLKADAEFLLHDKAVLTLGDVPLTVEIQ